MTQAQLEREVARVTGESLSTIRRRGFSVIEMPGVDEFDHPAAPQLAGPQVAGPQVVDWDALDARRTGIFADRRKRRAA